MKLEASWKCVKDDYKIVEVIGEGTGGQVVKGIHRETKIVVAIKKIDCGFMDLGFMKYVLREVSIMRQLTQMEQNIYTPKIWDILIPEKYQNDVLSLKQIFLIMEYYSNDLKQVLEAGVDGTDQKEHFKTILYNILCGINFIHSAGVMHRDIKPANILLKSDCSIKFCDFGLSRSCASQQQMDVDTMT
jgi:mitogen-activated protein kinase 1/3|tara:strand:+ start:80 stop:643 length:564 start_codon:yes stop_codon:yes gene_type:complete